MVKNIFLNIVCQKNRASDRDKGNRNHSLKVEVFFYILENFLHVTKNFKKAILRSQRISSFLPCLKVFKAILVQSKPNSVFKRGLSSSEFASLTQQYRNMLLISSLSAKHSSYCGYATALRKISGKKVKGGDTNLIVLQSGMAGKIQKLYCQ